MINDLSYNLQLNKFRKDSKPLLWIFWTRYTVPVFKKSSIGGSIQRFLLKLWRLYLVPIVAQQIGGQIFVDTWGFVFPANPRLAADYATKMVSVSHDGEGILGGRFLAACISAAYTATSLGEILDKGLSVIPKDSRYAQVVNSIISFYENDAQKEWKRCLSYIHNTFGYDKYPGNCHIIPNAAIIILSLLYGEGDFQKSQLICNTSGWDTDCNAGNVGAILGVFNGIEAIQSPWIGPIKDLLISSSVIGSLNIDTVSNTAMYFCMLGCRMQHVSPPAPWAARLEREGRIFHFDFQKSTQAIRPAADAVVIENCDQEVVAGHRSLRIAAKESSSMKVFLKTYYRPEDLSDSRYDPSFTPILFPGQQVTAVLMNRGNSCVEGALSACDMRHDSVYKAKLLLEPDATKTMTLHIPRIEGGLIRHLELMLTSLSDTPESLEVLLDSITFEGVPDYSIDFGREMIENYGFGHTGLHQEISQFTQNDGIWELDGSCLSGSCALEGEAYTGLYSMKDVTVCCTLEPILGYCHLLNFRVQGAARSYGFGFYGEDTLALVKKRQTYEVLQSIPFAFGMQQSHHLCVSVCGNRILASLDGGLVFDYQDDEAAYCYGQVGFTVRNGSHCHFRDLDIAPLRS